jgi:aminoglycoside phosphotransferase (APT) family kinase protein
VVRLFPEGSNAAEREYLAMDAAARHGLPVPAIVSRGMMANRQVLVSTFIDGALAIQVLVANPAQARAIGVAMGETLGRLHEVTAPAGIAARADAWIARGGPSLAAVRHLLAATPNQDRLLHLDYHPHNVLMREGRVTGVIDWENTLAGPPHMDLARTLAILRAAVLGNAIPAALHDTYAGFEHGLVAGHTAVVGADPHPNLSTAWGLAMTVEDLTAQLAKPGVFFTQSLLDRLAAERDALIRSLGAEE